MTTVKKYTSDDIAVLSDIEHVRIRTQIYLGNTNLTTYDVPVLGDGTFKVEPIEFVPASLRAVYEISDNAVDEFEQTGIAGHLTISHSPSTGKVTIADNGRGVPIDKHKSGQYTPEVVFGSLRSGRNFSNDKQKGVRGQNGVGSSCVAFTSKLFEIHVQRDGKKYHQVFREGSEIRTTPKITKTASTKTGTSISFILDPTVYKSTHIPEQLLNNIANEIAFNNPKVTVEITNEDTGKTQKFKYTKGLEDLVKKISSSYFKFTDNDGIDFFVLLDVHEGLDERMFTWVNSTILLDGGICNTQFLNSFCDIVTDAVQKDAKRAKCTVTKNDVRQNLLVLGSLKVSDPEFDSQSKTRLTGPNLKSNIHQMIQTHWAGFARKNKVWLEAVVERAARRHHGRADKEAQKEMTKKFTKVPGLLDATGADRSKCMLLITEGESASSQIEEVRTPATMGTFALTGKFNNVYGCTPAQLIEMCKLKNLLLAIGLIPGRKANRRDLRYGRIVITTDADADGDDIFTLLVNLFFQFWPELMDPDLPPIIYRLTAPNVAVIKGTKRVHFPRRGDYEAVREKYVGWSVQYYKGLGSMEKEDWLMVLPNQDLFYPLVDDGKMAETLELLFGPSADARKEWLQGTI